MSRLDKLTDELDGLVKRKLEINAGLEAVMRRKEYGDMIGHFHTAMSEQVRDLIGPVFAEIDAKLHPVQKATSINTESDDAAITDAVAGNIKPLASNQDFGKAFTDFLILIFNLGGQDFLNKHNIPATFDLQNEAVIQDVKVQSRATLTGVDQTTIGWVSDQISAGRQAGLSNADIADSIRSSIPDTYANRAEAVVRTETSAMVGQSEHMTGFKNGASHKEWVTVGGACPICQDNESAGMIGFDQAFPSGDLYEPAHPNCRCVVEYLFTPFMGSTWAGQ